MNKNEIGWACGTYGGEKWCVQGVWTEKLKGKNPLGKTNRRKNDNIKISLEELGWWSMDLLIWLRIETFGGLLYVRL